MNNKDHLFYGACFMLILILLCVVTIKAWDRIDALEKRIDNLEILVEVMTTNTTEEAATEMPEEPSDDEIQISIGNIFDEEVKDEN